MNAIFWAGVLIVLAGELIILGWLELKWLR